MGATVLAPWLTFCPALAPLLPFVFPFGFGLTQGKPLHPFFLHITKTSQTLLQDKSFVLLTETELLIGYHITLLG